MFRDDFVLPPNIPLSYVDSKENDEGRWMSWRPHDLSSEETEAKDKKDTLPKTPVISVETEGRIWNFNSLKKQYGAYSSMQCN